MKSCDFSANYVGLPTEERRKNRAKEGKGKGKGKGEKKRTDLYFPLKWLLFHCLERRNVMSLPFFFST